MPERPLSISDFIQYHSLYFWRCLMCWEWFRCVWCHMYLCHICVVPCVYVCICVVLGWRCRRLRLHHLVHREAEPSDGITSACDGPTATVADLHVCESAFKHGHRHGHHVCCFEINYIYLITLMLFYIWSFDLVYETSLNVSFTIWTESVLKKKYIEKWTSFIWDNMRICLFYFCVNYYINQSVLSQSHLIVFTPIRCNQLATFILCCLCYVWPASHGLIPLCLSVGDLWVRPQLFKALSSS